jgi:threonine dehydrogenase-like Zn-dependent dehydrogenase
MRCVRFLGGERVEVATMPVPQCGPDEAIVRVAISAICGSELPAYRRGMGGSTRPNPGHEMAGVVSTAGDGCGLTVGQRVGLQVMRGCGRCRHCARGDFGHCVAGVRVLSGTHCEYVVVPKECLVPLPDDMDWETAVLLCGDTLGTPYRALQRLGGARGGDFAAVFGCGPIGLGSLVWLKHFGARVIVSEPTPYRRQLAAKLGANVVVSPSHEDVVERVHRETDGGADICLDCSESAQTLADALDSVSVHGRVAFIGEKPKASISPSDQFIRKEITVVGSWYFTTADYYEQLRHYRRGLPVAGLITHRFRMGDAQQAYTHFSSGHSGKVVFVHE